MTVNSFTDRDFKQPQLTQTLNTLAQQLTLATGQEVALWQSKLPKLSEEVRLQMARHIHPGLRALAIDSRASNRKIWELLRYDPTPLVRRTWLGLPKLTAAQLLELAQSARPDEIPDIVAHPRFDRKIRQALKVHQLVPWAAMTQQQQLACLIDPDTPLATIVLLALSDHVNLTSRAVFHPALTPAHLLGLCKVAGVQTREALSWVPDLNEETLRVGLQKDRGDYWRSCAWLKRADFPAELANELAESASTALLHALLEIQPELNGDLLRKWVGSPELEVRLALARRPDLPLELLSLLRCDPDRHVRAEVAGQAQLPPEWIEELLKDADEQVRAALAQHQPNLTPAQLSQLALDAQHEVRRGVASRPGLPAKLAEQLLHDGHFWVRYGLSINETIPVRIRAHFLPGLVRGAEDASSGMAASWVGQDIARELDADTVNELLSRGDDLPVVTEVALLRNPNFPAGLRKEWLKDMLETEQDYVIEILSGNPALDAEDIEKLLAYKNGACYTQVHPSHPLSTEQLQTLIEHHWDKHRTLEYLIQHPAFQHLKPEALLLHSDFGVFFTVLWQRGQLAAERPDLQGKAIDSSWRPRSV